MYQKDNLKDESCIYLYFLSAQPRNGSKTTFSAEKFWVKVCAGEKHVRLQEQHVDEEHKEAGCFESARQSAFVLSIRQRVWALPMRESSLKRDVENLKWRYSIESFFDEYFC